MVSAARPLSRTSSTPAARIVVRSCLYPNPLTVAVPTIQNVAVTTFSTASRSRESGADRAPGSAWDKLLLAVLGCVAAYAVALVVAGEQVSRLVFDPLGFGLERPGDLSGEAIDYIVFVYGVLGAVILGWMIVLIGIACGPLRRRERWAWWTVVTSSVMWFVADTGMSLAAGQPSHAAFNVAFLVLLGAPLVGIGRQLRRT